MGKVCQHCEYQPSVCLVSTATRILKKRNVPAEQDGRVVEYSSVAVVQFGRDLKQHVGTGRGRDLFFFSRGH